MVERRLRNVQPQNLFILGGQSVDPMLLIFKDGCWLQFDVDTLCHLAEHLLLGGSDGL